MYLHKGGRLSLTSGIFGTILGIKPVLTFNEEGGLSVVYKVRGRKRTIRNLARRVVEDGVELDKYEVYVVDADCGEDGDLLARLIKEGRPEAEVKRQIVGPVIASHCGPGTLGVIFVAKERPIKLSVPGAGVQQLKKRRLLAVFLFCLFEEVNCARDGVGGTSGSFPSALCAVHFAQQLGGYVKFD